MAIGNDELIPLAGGSGGGLGAAGGALSGGGGGGGGAVAISARYSIQALGTITSDGANGVGDNPMWVGGGGGSGGGILLTAKLSSIPASASAAGGKGGTDGSGNYNGVYANGSPGRVRMDGPAPHRSRSRRPPSQHTSEYPPIHRNTCPARSRSPVRGTAIKSIFISSRSPGHGRLRQQSGTMRTTHGRKQSRCRATTRSIVLLPRSTCRIPIPRAIRWSRNGRFRRRRRTYCFSARNIPLSPIPGIRRSIRCGAARRNTIR